MTSLESPESYAVDASGMFQHIERLGTELELAWDAHGHSPLDGARPDSLTLAGMGGSASAADYFATIVERTASIPLDVVRDYHLPGHVGPGSLVVVVSYSGTTDEALSCFQEALGRGASTFSVTTGGALAELARKHGQPACIIDYDAPPRAALAHTLAPLIAMAPAVGAPGFTSGAIEQAAGAHRTRVRAELGRGAPAGSNPAKQAANDLALGGIPVIFAAEHLAPVGRRAKNQFAENAKTLASFEEMPEASHNTVVSLEEPGLRQVGLAFDSPLLDSGNRRRIESIARLFSERAFPFYCYRLSGQSPLADMFEATAFVDFASCYLAMLRGIDPTPTTNLTRVRAEAAAAEAV